jgi:hypothetical protein
MLTKSSKRLFRTVNRSWPLVVVVILFTLASYAPTRISALQKCPTITCQGLAHPPFKCSVSPLLPGAGYKWQATVGTIASGQGTPNITIKDLPSGTAVKVTVELTGITGECPQPNPVYKWLGPWCLPPDVLSCPKYVKEGEAVTFRYYGLDNWAFQPEDVTFNWTISAGILSSGHGTRSITVDTSGLPVGTPIEATVDIGGLDMPCAASGSCTTTVLPGKAKFKISEFGAVDFMKELAAALKAVPYSQGYVIVFYNYHDRFDKENEAYVQGRANAIKSYLVQEQKLDAARIKIQIRDSDSIGQKVELWEVPPGVELPIKVPTTPKSP